MLVKWILNNNNVNVYYLCSFFYLNYATIVDKAELYFTMNILFKRENRFKCNVLQIVKYLTTDYPLLSRKFPDKKCL